MFSRTFSTLRRTTMSAVRPFTTTTVPALATSNLNPKVVNAAYAVRGELVIKAEALQSKLRAGDKLPFDKVVLCNIGNPQELGQQPVTFFRQVLSLLHYPQLLSHPKIHEFYPIDAIERAKSYLSSMSGGMGAYTSSLGVTKVREEVARFIEQRDGYKANVEDIFLSDGASASVKNFLQILIRNNKDGVLTPIPQYPLYSATLTLLGGECVKYYLNEQAGWSLSYTELQRAYEQGVKDGITPRALVIINPGNPTGQVLPLEAMKEIVTFCEQTGIVLMADEVYQTNIYGSTPFISFKKVVMDMKSNVQLVSFHSVSKGFLGECGQRGGYMELVNIDPDVKAQLYKLASVSLCSNTSGQIMVGLMTNPPKQGDASYELYVKERDGQLSSLKRRAHQVATKLNECEGITCNAVEGAMYAFPQITLPSKAVEAAKSAGKAADVFYCLALLDATGICVVPGSGFGQRDGTWHFRTTILPSEANMEGVMTRFANFHKSFMQQYK